MFYVVSVSKHLILGSWHVVQAEMFVFRPAGKSCKNCLQGKLNRMKLTKKTVIPAFIWDKSGIPKVAETRNRGKGFSGMTKPFRKEKRHIQRGGVTKTIF